MFGYKDHISPICTIRARNEDKCRLPSLGPLQVDPWPRLPLDPRVGRPQMPRAERGGRRLRGTVAICRGPAGHMLGLCTLQQRPGGSWDGKRGARLLPREAVTGCGLAIFFVASTPKSSRAPEGRTDAQVGFAASAADCARAPASQNGCRKLRRPRGENQVVTRSRGHRRPSWLPVYPEAPAKGAARLHLGQVEGRRRKPWRPSARLALRSRND